MDVTKSTFNDLLPRIKESINNCSFVTIDCEFSGLSTNNEINSFDTQRQYYEKIRRGSKDFLLIQYGLCLFRYDKENKCFKQQAFNFYIFPKAVPKYVQDQRFLCQVSSIDFLVAQDFDFNKLFRHGIPYLNNIQETKYRDLLSESHRIREQNNSGYNTENSNKVVATKEADKIFVETIRDQIETFLQSEVGELTLPKCNGFLRLLIYQMVREDYNNKVDIRTVSDNRERVMVITKFKSLDDRRIELRKLMQEEEMDLENTVGFAKVIKHLIESRKLIVGHNMVLDLLHTVDKFLHPLPEDYDEFKDCIHCLFPRVLDTKYISVSEPFGSLIASNVLGHLLDTLSNSPFTMPKIELEMNGFGYNLKQRKEHEAAYDAFMTGVCFLTMWNYLGEDLDDNDEIFGNFDLLEPYLNKLYLMRLQDCPYIHLGGEDPKPTRDHVFYLTFPKDWKSSDISQLFSPFGAVHIAWINDVSAYVGLMKRQEAAVALSTLSQSDTYTITTFAKRQAYLAGLPTVAKSPMIKRKLSDGYVNKRRRISGKDLQSSRSIEPVIESSEIEEESKKTTEDEVTSVETVPIAITGRKRTISKTFQEDNSWD